MISQIAPQNYKGIPFMQLHLLPEDQKLQFEEWLSETDKVRIMSGNPEMNQYVHYKDYSFWFDNIYLYDKSLENQL